MIVIRDIFQLKFGMAKEAKTLLKEGEAINTRAGYGPGRAMVDLVGPYYTLVLETPAKSLAEYEEALHKIMGMKEWSDWYAKFTNVVESGRREIFTVL